MCSGPGAWLRIWPPSSFWYPFLRSDFALGSASHFAMGLQSSVQPRLPCIPPSPISASTLELALPSFWHNSSVALYSDGWASCPCCILCSGAQLFTSLVFQLCTSIKHSMGLNSSHLGLPLCFGLHLAMSFNHSRVVPQIVMSFRSPQLCTCPCSSTCSLGSPISLSWLYFCFLIATVFSPCFGLPFCIGLPHQLVSILHSASPPCSLASPLHSWSGLFFSLEFSLSPVQAHCSGSCSMVLLLRLASAPGGLCLCPWGSFSGRERTLCCLSVCLSCHVGCSGAGGAVLCWQCPGPRVHSEQEPGMGRGAQQLQGGSCCAKSKSTCTAHGSGRAQDCSFLHRLK